MGGLHGCEPTDGWLAAAAEAREGTVPGPLLTCAHSPSTDLTPSGWPSLQHSPGLSLLAGTQAALQSGAGAPPPSLGRPPPPPAYPGSA